MSACRYETMLEMIRKAGSLALELSHSPVVVEAKGVNDYVTQADRRVETFIRSTIGELYPDDGVMGEEYGTMDSHDGYVWVIDPIDGTVDFMNSFPLYCISVALEKDGKLVAGAVYNPVYDELFHARAGCGAYLGRTRLSGTSVPFEKSVALVVPPHRRHESLERFWANERRIYAMVSDTRSIGSAAMSTCYVACGRASMYYEWYLHYYDYAAAMLIAQEAGCNCITRTEGDLTNILVVSGAYAGERIEEVLEL